VVIRKPLPKYRENTRRILRQVFYIHATNLEGPKILTPSFMTVADIKKYKDSLYSALSRDLSDFEKNFLLIAAGVLTFSITFIKDIVEVPQSSFLPCLFIGWTLFALSVGIMMLTFIKSAYASDELWFKVDDILMEINKFEDTDAVEKQEVQRIKQETNQILIHRKSQLRRMRYGAIAAFLAGMVVFGFFVGYNLMIEQQPKPAGHSEEITIDKRSRTVMLNDWKLSINDSTVVLKKSGK
jgi:hypothetical protein